MDGNDRVQTIVRPAGALEEWDWQELWELNREFFDVERWYAENELFRRQHIATFRQGHALIGMAAIDVFGAKFRGRRIAVILTTNVLLRESWRGQNLIQKLGLRTFLRARLRYPFRPIYWFFDSSSYKSYLLLSRNFPHLLAAPRATDAGNRRATSSTSLQRRPTAPAGARRKEWSSGRCASDCAAPPFH